MPGEHVLVHIPLVLWMLNAHIGVGIACPTHAACIGFPCSVYFHVCSTNDMGDVDNLAAYYAQLKQQQGVAPTPVVPETPVQVVKRDVPESPATPKEQSKVVRHDGYALMFREILPETVDEPGRVQPSFAPKHVQVGARPDAQLSVRSLIPGQDRVTVVDYERQQSTVDDLCRHLQPHAQVVVVDGGQVRSLRGTEPLRTLVDAYVVQ